MEMELTKILIDRAAAVCGSKRKLAEALGVSPQTPTDWTSGKSLPNSQHTARMAEMCGVRIEDALLARDQDELARTEEGKRLLGVMKRGFLAGAVAISAAFSANATVIPTSVCQPVIDTLYIVSSHTIRIVAAFARHPSAR
jgi:transcriptional regulator with XRE-family HTH domain